MKLLIAILASLSFTNNTFANTLKLKKSNTTYFNQVKEMFLEGQNTSLESLSYLGMTGRCYGKSNQNNPVKAVFLFRPYSSDIAANSINAHFYSINSYGSDHSNSTYEEAESERYPGKTNLRRLFRLESGDVKTKDMTVRKYNDWFILERKVKDSVSYRKGVIKFFLELPGDNSSLPTADEIYNSIYVNNFSHVSGYNKGDYRLMWGKETAGEVFKIGIKKKKSYYDSFYDFTPWIKVPNHNNVGPISQVPIVSDYVVGSYCYFYNFLKHEDLQGDIID